MRTATLLLATSLTVGCVDATGDQPATPPAVKSEVVMSHVLDSAAQVILNDGALKPEPRIKNTRDAMGATLVATEYAFGKTEPMDATWRAAFNAAYDARFQPDGEVQPLTAALRLEIAEFLKDEARALRGETTDE